MARRQDKTPHWQRIIVVAGVLLIVVLLATVLYWGRPILIPLALAILLSFVLSPLVERLDRIGLGRIPAVLLVVVLASALLGSLMWLFVYQLNSLAHDLPSYRENIARKLASIQTGGEDTAIGKIQDALNKLARELDGREAKAASGAGADAEVSEKPIPVTVVTAQGADRLLSNVATSMAALGPALGLFATGGLTSILVIFMLIQYDDLRNRLVSFSSSGGLSTTTKALDEAGYRIGRYLVMQLIINGTYGIAVFIGLWIIGVPYAFLWGLFAAVFRYIPYIGPWLAALLPLTVSVMSSPGWWEVLLAAGLFVVLELLSNNFMEPWLYGQGVGVSMVALVISAALWTLIWGPAGLILATPLTVCLAVVGRYVPELNFLDRLLGKEPDLEPHMIYLQRLVAGDREEAAEIASEFHEIHDEAIYDELLIPALGFIRKERTLGSMSADEEESVCHATAEIVVSCTPSVRAGTSTEAETDPSLVQPDQNKTTQDHFTQIESEISPWHGKSGSNVVVGAPAHNEMDELVLLMVGKVLRQDNITMRVVSPNALPSDVIRTIAQEKPPAVLISVMPPQGLEQARYLCRQLRKRCADMRIIVGVWDYQGNLDRLIVKFRSVGADYITTTVRAAQGHLRSVFQRRESLETTVSD